MVALKYEAVIQCQHEDDGRTCTEQATYVEENIEGLTPTQFGDAAIAAFRERGWKIRSHGIGRDCCPSHA